MRGLLLLLLVFQASLPPPEAIFAPGVAYEQTGRPEKRYTFEIDHERERIFITDGERGLRVTVRYPQGVERVLDVGTENDGVFPVSVIEPEGRQWVWTLDFERADLSRYEAQCNEPEIITLPNPQAPWRYVAGGICHALTGERIDLDREWQTELRPSLSPDGADLALFAEGPDDEVTLYSYHFETGLLRSLGVFSQAGRVNVQRWVGDQVHLYDVLEDGTTRLYIAHAQQENTLEFAFQRPSKQPSYFVDPPRYEFIAQNTDGCVYVRYDVETAELERQDTGWLCEAEYGQTLGVGYYRDVAPGDVLDAAQTPLVRFNPRTGARETLFTGEVESIEWVSPDERYAILTLDTTGILDNPPHRDPSQPSQPPLRPHLALVDLETGEILYELYSAWGFAPDRPGATGAPLSSLVPLENGRFVAIADNQAFDWLPGLNGEVDPVFRRRNRAFAEQVEVEPDGDVTVTPLIEDAFLMTPDQTGLLLWDGSGTDESLLSLGRLTPVSRYDLETGEVTPVINDIDRSRYDIQVSRGVDGLTLRIWLINDPSSQAFYQFSP